MANNNCEIKPVLKKYPFPNVINNLIRSVILKVENEAIVIDIPKPIEIRPVLSLYIYNNKLLKSILFSISNGEIQDYKKKDLKLSKNTITDYRKGWINCDNLPIEVSLNSKEYSAFLLSYPDIKDQYDLFVIPKSKKIILSTTYNSLLSKKVKLIIS